MFDLNAPILPYNQIGNIEIGKNISKYEEYFFLVGSYPLEKKINNNFSITYFNIENKLSVVYKENIVIGITAERDYKGKYENNIYVGISLFELRKMNKSMIMLNGGIIFDNNYGMVLWLSSPDNELYDDINELSDSAYIDSITVGNYDEWKNFSF